MFDQNGTGAIRYVKFNSLPGQTLLGLGDHQIYNFAEMLRLKGVEGDHFVDAIEQFWPEEVFDGQQDLRALAFLLFCRIAFVLSEARRASVVARMDFKSLLLLI